MCFVRGFQSATNAASTSLLQLSMCVGVQLGFELDCLYFGFELDRLYLRCALLVKASVMGPKVSVELCLRTSARYV